MTMLLRFAAFPVAMLTPLQTHTQTHTCTHTRFYGYLLSADRLVSTYGCYCCCHYYYRCLYAVAAVVVADIAPSPPNSWQSDD